MTNIQTLESKQKALQIVQNIIKAANKIHPKTKAIQQEKENLLNLATEKIKYINSL